MQDEEVWRLCRGCDQNLWVSRKVEEFEEETGQNRTEGVRRSESQRVGRWCLLFAISLDVSDWAISRKRGFSDITFGSNNEAGKCFLFLPFLLLRS